MLYLLLGSTSAGIAGIFYALWRASKAETRAVRAEGELAEANDNSKRWKTENDSMRSEFSDQLSRKDSEIQTLKGQRDALLIQLEKSGSPGSLRDSLRVSLGIK